MDADILVPLLSPHEGCGIIRVPCWGGATTRAQQQRCCSLTDIVVSILLSNEGKAWDQSASHMAKAQAHAKDGVITQAAPRAASQDLIVEYGEIGIVEGGMEDTMLVRDRSGNTFVSSEHGIHCGKSDDVPKGIVPMTKCRVQEPGISEVHAMRVCEKKRREGEVVATVLRANAKKEIFGHPSDSDLDPWRVTLARLAESEELEAARESQQLQGDRILRWKRRTFEYK